MIVCGKRLSICCSFLSIWAIIMLTLMGILLYSHALAFAEDLEIEPRSSKITDRKILISEAYSKYENAAHNCWIAVCLYIITLALSLHQYYLNRKVQYGL
ncbi:ribonuclease kappa-B [Tetranychus urticae]|uniref:Uncharacterized protein n=1 Tax=Tetranychus urticae TaxID=32264 RepID=T1K1Q7_TETUR|nr:ribonuclease kappa-B [Tetranychus urticae]